MYFFQTDRHLEKERKSVKFQNLDFHAFDFLKTIESIFCHHWLKIVHQRLIAAKRRKSITCVTYRVVH